MTDPSADLLKVRDVAKLYDVTTQAVYLWIKDRGLPTVRLGGEVRIRRVELNTWLERERGP